MNYQLLDEDEEYFDDTDSMGLALYFDGSTFKKVYHDDELGYNTSKFIRAKDIIVPYELHRAWRLLRSS